MAVAGVVNWKTTLGATFAACGLALLGYAGPVLMGQDVSISDVISDPRFQTYAGIVLSSLGAVITGFFARDKDKSSQDNGLRPPVDPNALDAEIAARVKAELKSAGIK